MPRISSLILAGLLFLGHPGAGVVHGQCILANPSFELDGSGGQIFGGWNQFGEVGASTDASHGSMAARVSGPDLGGWDVSAYWQRLDTAPGERWSASVTAWHSSVKPLSGESQAILNIEWRDGGGDLIGYESHAVADASTPPDTPDAFLIVSGPAPSGTVATHFLLGVLQSPAEPAPDVFYDQATFDSLGPPTLDERQWGDFPGGSVLDFGGRSWRVKGPGYYGPGPNQFCDTASCTWVDIEGRLHLTVQNISGTWYSTEVALEEPLGYGDYIFTTRGRLDDLHPNTVLGLFLWQYGPCYDPANGWWNPYNEIDVEFSRWGDPGRDVGQFVAQPFDYPGNLDRFDATFSDGELTSHAFRWLSDRVEYRSWRGGPREENPGTLMHSWTYTGPHIPRPDQPRVHINLWQFDGPPSSIQEIVLDEFLFVPAGDAPVAVPDDTDSPGAPPRLSAAAPNPFGSRTRIRYDVPQDGAVEVVVYDVAGRLVRTLVSEYRTAGDHEVAWDGRDDDGDPAASGIYLYRYRAGDVVETRRVALLR